MKSAVRKMGNSQGVIIPKPLLAEVGAQIGDEVDVTAKKGRLIVTPRKRRVREGWAEASKRLAAAGDANLVWSEFGNDADKDWTW